MGADKRRFTDSLEKLKKKHNIVTPELDDDKVRLAHKIKDLTLEDIKSRIPRIFFSGILLSADILYNDHLRGRDMKKKKEAAAVFLEKLGNPSILKNLSALEKGEAGKKGDPPKVDWGGEAKK